MNRHLQLLLLTLALVHVVIVGMAQTAYIPNQMGSNVSVIDLSTNNVVGTIPVGLGPTGVSVSLDGTKVYIMNRTSKTVSVINTDSNTVSATIAVGGIKPGRGCVTPDGSKLYVTDSWAGTITVINTATNTVATEIPLFSANGIAISPDGSKAYVATQIADEVVVINTADDSVMDTILVGDNVNSVCVTPDGSKVYAANSSDWTVSVINALVDTVSATIPTNYSYPDCMAVTPDGSKLYVVNSTSNVVSVIDIATNTILTYIHVNHANGISITPDGSKVYVTQTFSNMLAEISTATNTITDNIPVGNFPLAYGNFISTHQFVGISDHKLDESNISIYPNPFTSQTILSFSNEQKNITIEITDVLGREIKTTNFTGKQFTLLREEMSTGVYLVKVTGENKSVVSKKIIVQ